MQKNKRTTLLLLSVLAVSAVIAPGMYMNAAKADVTPQQFEDFGNIFSDPSNVGSVIGSMIGGMDGFQDNILGSMFNMMFSQIMNFDDQEMLPGQNVYVFSATANSTSASAAVDDFRNYTTYAPYQDADGNTYRVRVVRDVDVNVTFKQEAMVVLILWDDDGSLVTAIQKVLAVVKEGIAWAEAHGGEEEIPQELIEKAAECVTWMLVHINDIITGDEQIIFQPSYYWSYNVTGTMTETHEWRYAHNNTSVDPATRAWSSEAASDDYMNYLRSPNESFSGTMSDTGFLFHLFQLWMQKFQISINMSKIGDLIEQYQLDENFDPGEEALANLLEGVDVKFAFTQHHLVGGVLFDDVDGNGVPTVDYVTTNITYTDSSGTKNVTIPTTSELRYMLDIASSGSDWTATEPHRVGDSIKWKVMFNNPTIKATPIGMDDYEATISGNSTTMSLTNMSYGFTFQPAFEDVNVPAADGSIVKTVKLGKGTIKLDQAFGDFDGGSLPSNIDGLSMAVVYLSHIFKFDFSYRNEENPDVSEETEWYERADGTLDFLDSSSESYFGQIDIAGPNYELANGNTYPASTSIIPIAMLQFTYEAERNIANDDFSISEGETAFRTQSLYLDVSSAWALYCVAYPHWDGTALVHDPMFSIFMELDNPTPWAVILLVVAIGALVGGAILIYVRKQRSL